MTTLPARRRLTMEEQELAIYAWAYALAEAAGLLRNYKCRRCQEVTKGPPDRGPACCSHCLLFEWLLPMPPSDADLLMEVTPGPSFEPPDFSVIRTCWWTD